MVAVSLLRNIQTTVPNDSCESTKAKAGWWSGNRWFMLVVALLFIVCPGVRWIIGHRSPGDLPHGAGDSQLHQSFQQEEMKVDRSTVPVDLVAQATERLNQSSRYALSGQFAQCVNAAKEATRLNPAFAAAFNNLGFCLAGLEHWEEAIRQTREALRLDPTLQPARDNLIWMMQEQARLGGK